VELNSKPSTTTPAKSHDSHLESSDIAKPEVETTHSTIDVPEHVECEVAEPVTIATESYTPAPTVDSYPTTPIVSYQHPVGETQFSPQMTSSREGTQQNSVLGTYGCPGSWLPDSLSHVSKHFSTCGSLLDIFHPGRLGIWLRPCKNAAKIHQSIRKTASGWARYLEAQFEDDPSSEQYRALRFTFPVSDRGPMTYEQLGNVMLFSPGFINLGETYASLQGSGLGSTTTGLARWAQYVAEMQAKIYSSHGVAEYNKSVLGDSRNTTSGSKAPFGEEDAEIKIVIDDNRASGVGCIDIPEGTSNRLADLTFLFTGQFKYVSREEGQDLVKRHGGKITFAPSRRTDYVVRGDEADLERFAIVKERFIKIIDEKGLFDLILRRSQGIQTFLKQPERLQQKSMKKFNKAIQTSWTAINTLYEYDWVSASTSNHQSQQHTSQEQQRQRAQHIASFSGQFLDHKQRPFSPTSKSSLRPIS
jgi:hypothetical protein